jgi:uncharacterized protein YjbJ (UPF0337 family)
LIGRATTNLAPGIHHEAYDCDNHNEAAEYAAKLEAGLLPSNINVLIFDHLVSAVEQRVWNGKSFKPHHMQPGFLCARERKLTLSVSSPGLHLRECAMDKDRIAGSAKAFSGEVEGTVGDIAGDAKTQAAGRVREATGTAQNLYGQAKDAAREATDAAVSYAKDAYENSGDTVRDGSQAIAKKVQDNPLGSILIAGGIGFALALLMTRSPRRPPQRWR